MKPKYLFTIVAASLFLSACGSASNSSDTSTASSASSSPTEGSGFSWTTDLLYEAMLDPKLVESWGFVNTSGKSAVDDFKTDSGNFITDIYTKVKPSSCETVANVVLNRSELDANQYSFLNHYDPSSGIAATTFMLYTFTFDSPEEAQGIFDNLKANQSECSTITYAEGSEIFTLDLWEGQPSVDQPDLTIGGTSYGTASAIGLNGSAIWSLFVIIGDGGEAEALATKAAGEINSKLTAVQGK